MKKIMITLIISLCILMGMLTIQSEAANETNKTNTRKQYEYARQY